MRIRGQEKQEHGINRTEAEKTVLNLSSVTQDTWKKEYYLKIYTISITVSLMDIISFIKEQTTSITPQKCENFDFISAMIPLINILFHMTYRQK